MPSHAHAQLNVVADLFGSNKNIRHLGSSLQQESEEKAVAANNARADAPSREAEDSEDVGTEAADGEAKRSMRPRTARRYMYPWYR